jgi:hypothetical protein
VRAQHEDAHAPLAAHRVLGRAAGAAGCPSARLQQFERPTADRIETTESRRPSELRQWPIQMNLVPPSAPFLRDADLVLAAD